MLTKVRVSASDEKDWLNGYVEKQINLGDLERARLALSKVKYSDSKMLQIKEAAEKLPDNITVLIGRNADEQFNSKLA